MAVWPFTALMICRRPSTKAEQSVLGGIITQRRGEGEASKHELIACQHKRKAGPLVKAALARVVVGMEHSAEPAYQALLANHSNDIAPGHTALRQGALWGALALHHHACLLLSTAPT